jgi:hypothetical protein
MSKEKDLRRKLLDEIVKTSPQKILRQSERIPRNTEIVLKEKKPTVKKEKKVEVKEKKEIILDGSQITILEFDFISERKGELSLKKRSRVTILTDFYDGNFTK